MRQHMSDITKDDLKTIVFVNAHKSGELTDEVQRHIDTFDANTYRQYLDLALERRERCDRTDEDGGGTRSASYLREAIENLEHILSR